MCSIYGTIGKNFKNIENIFSKELHHRGPDDCGIFYDNINSLSLGHTRLSIIDLSCHGHQPMLSNDCNYILTFNGEIYNYQEIKNDLISLGYNFTTNTDTEVVLKSYIEFGKDCINLFRGMFAFCIYDKLKKELFLARDRFGIKPLIYTFLDDQFIFCSELKPFLKSNFISKKLSHVALGQYFKYGSVTQPNTMLDGVYQLMPGYSMVVKFDNTSSIKCYYDFIKESLNFPKIGTYTEAVDQVRNRLEEATAYHMVADVDVGAFLSGGVDSTAVVALMKKHSLNKISTFSVGFKDKTGIEDETDVATRTATHFGCNHRNIKIDSPYVENIFDDFIESLDQPSFDGFNTYIVSLEAAKELKVAISGLGGDEIFAGYPHFELISKYSKRKKGIISYYGKKLNKLRPNRFTKKFEFFGIDEYSALDQQRTIVNNFNKLFNDKETIPMFKKLQRLSSVQKISYAEIGNYMLNTLLRDNDILSMAHSLEVRPVLLDHKLVELAFSLQDNYKIRNDLLKSVFVDSVKDIIPQEVWLRKKTGFEMPLCHWMNGCFNRRFKSLVNSNISRMIYSTYYADCLNRRVQSKKALRKDWLNFIVLSWLDKYDLEL